MRTEKELHSLAIEARAQIFWGKSPDEIRNWLSDKEVSHSDIKRIISDSVRERALEFRKRGIVEIILGVIIAGAGGAIIAGMYFVGFFNNSYSMKILIILLLVVVYGLYRIFKGLWWILAGNKNVVSLATG